MSKNANTRLSYFFKGTKKEGTFSLINRVHSAFNPLITSAYTPRFAVRRVKQRIFQSITKMEKNMTLNFMTRLSYFKICPQKFTSRPLRLILSNICLIELYENRQIILMWHQLPMEAEDTIKKDGTHKIDAIRFLRECNQKSELKQTLISRQFQLAT